MKAFTLMETVFSCFLIGMVLVIVFNLFPSSLLAIRRGEEQLQAENLAQDRLESARAAAFTSHAVGDSTGPIPLAVGPTRYVYQVDVVAIPDTDATRLKALRATVTWSVRGQDYRVERETWITSVKT